MALATQCPHCLTTFRVANDQLKLRAGLVRCGSCREVFNGIEHLVRPDHPAAADTPGPIVAKDERDHSQASPAYHAVPPVAEYSTAAASTAASSSSVPPAITPTKTTNPAPVANKWFGALERRNETPQNLPLADSAPPSSSRNDALSTISAPTHSPPLTPVGVGMAEASSRESAQQAVQPVQPSFARLRPGEVPPTPPYQTPNAAAKISNQPLIAENSVEKSPDVWHRSTSNESQDNELPRPQGEDDPLQRMTLFQVASGNTLYADNVFMSDNLDSAEDEELDRLIDELQNRQWNGKKKTSAELTTTSRADVTLNGSSEQVNPESLHQADLGQQDVLTEPRFMQQAKRKQRVGGVVRTGMWIGSIILAFALIGQIGYHYRDQLAASFPPLKPVLQGVCGKLGCQLNLPMHIDDLSIESNELQLMAPDRNLYALTLLMRNRSSTVQAWPSIELTLNDASDKTVARRVFAPGDYLTAPTDPAEGFHRNTERPVKLTFELLQLKASGYRVYLFYP
ncbi:DUF3426 domain-containing protein [Glaciimonas sp. PAMC28666]|uniref:DUF3426 domain-containing protein n=1 Tax=Glaciimonas sp. PAMC28666 TaxID=2807626 RepID=UPI00196633D4|nr:DUF3426 domain-containing protein [Glaciimonas sp. PAMC28666]QRX80975.1 zinc-ribbon domain-containing protein [Glaciimonas sp. PAMC28666]